MSLLSILEDEETIMRTPRRWQDQIDNPTGHTLQLMLSVVLGSSAFLTFCFLRPRWTELYNARKKQSTAARILPDLPKTMFGWIPVVARISRAEVLASAGLDAYAFLALFRYAIKFLCVTLFFSLTIILPVNSKFTGEPWLPGWNSTVNYTYPGYDYDPDYDDDRRHRHDYDDYTNISNSTDGSGGSKTKIQQSYLWMYVAFVYVFTFAAIYLMVSETKNIIRVRQAYLGTQATITDKTIRLSGIPIGMRSEERIREFIEDLGIGKVDSVMLCRNWSRLDKLSAERMKCLRKLEESWATYLGDRHSLRQGWRRRRPGLNTGSSISDGIETTALLSQDESAQQQAAAAGNPRPTYSVHYGFLNLRRKKVDAIDRFSSQLVMLDARVLQERDAEFKPTALAFVTMESIAACQMAVQAILDPTPGQLIATLAPPPVDVVWRNTYRTRNSRMMRSWSIMVAIGFLTIFWALLLIPLAGLLSIEAIDKVFPGLATALEKHKTARSLVQNGLPTLVFSLLAIAVPHLYNWFSNRQGMTSQGEVELSLISKNFFFVFFNLFIVFTIWGSAASLLDFWDRLQDLLKDTTAVAFAVARSLEKLSPFYVNLIILQAFGILPFRLLEFGDVFTYPFKLTSVKTPRDYADLIKAPIFGYGFFLPQTMLIFVICTVYSVLPSSWLITVFGLIYFIVGGFIYKFQLLYAMDHRQYSTGRLWPMICNRIILGLVIFHIAMAGYLTLRKALKESITIIPLLMGTVWFMLYFQRTYFPLMEFIALRSIENTPTPPIMPTPTQTPWDRATDRGRTVDMTTRTGLRYMNPNLMLPLETLWIRKSGRAPSYRSISTRNVHG